MTPSERAALRELVAKVMLRPVPGEPGVTYNGDAAFIAAARDALPALLDDCERLEKENVKLAYALTVLTGRIKEDPGLTRRAPPVAGCCALCDAMLRDGPP